MNPKQNLYSTKCREKQMNMNAKGANDDIYNRTYRNGTRRAL